jgi:hypothetical protein
MGWRSLGDSNPCFRREGARPRCDSSTGVAPTFERSVGGRGSAPIRCPVTTPCPRTFLEQLATILLPNSVARAGIRRDEVIPPRRVVPLIQYFVTQAGTEQYGGERISSAVLSTTQPPLRGRKGTNIPVGRRLCIQRETAKQERRRPIQAGDYGVSNRKGNT